MNVDGAVANSLQIQGAGKFLDLSIPKIMGILNLTPDSFYDGGKYTTLSLALTRVSEMVEEGADIIDIGAESSRPFAQSISPQEELDRIMPLLEAIKTRFDVMLSVDTYKPRVMQTAIELGVHMINDIYALQQPGAIEAVSKSNVAICLMHMQGTPNTMQDHPSYMDVIKEVSVFLQARKQHCLENGIAADRIIVDPGFGFGKTTMHNLQLLRNMKLFKQIGPLLVGFSRKSSIGEILASPLNERMYGSLAAHIIALTEGASIIRTHDIKPTADAIKIVTAVFA